MNRKLPLNQVFRTDNLELLRALPAHSVDFIYVDPPFFSGRDFERDDIKHFNDQWKDLQAFLGFLKPRLIEMHRTLKPTGSMILHLDWHACHYAKVMMDEIFGYERFINEIVWQYKTGGASRRWLSRKHDTLLWYGKTDRYQFFPFKEKSYLSHKYGFKNVEILEDERGPYTWVNARDVWDIAAIRGNQPQSLGYSTQKPEELLERIVKMTTQAGDVVADFFAGSGTTLAVAKRMGRAYLGCDLSKEAVQIAEKRLRAEPDRPAEAAA